MNSNQLDSNLDLHFLHLNDERWANYLAADPRATIFHHPSWSQLLADTYGYEPFVLAACNARGEILAGVPLMKVRSFFNKERWVSLPFTDHCAPLFSAYAALQSLTDYLVAQAEADRVSRIELRFDYPTLPATHRYSDYVLHRLALAPDEAEVSRHIKRKHFRQVRVAEERGVEIKKGTDAGFIEAFYHLHLLTRRRLGVPVQPRNFFELLVPHITQQGLGFVLLAYKEQECVAGAVFLNWNGTLTYKYSASIEKARQLLAMDLLLWSAIRWGCRNGYECMDLGRTDYEDEGLRYFKRRWGAEEIPLDYVTIADHVEKPAAGQWARRMRPIIQKSPTWVCRAVGELLYGYFG